MPIKTKKVKATTNNITKGIVSFLINRGHSASRVNTTGIWDTKRKVFRTTGARVGFYDIACTIKTGIMLIGPGNIFPGRYLGVTLMIDTKRGRDSLSDEQKEFKAEIEEAGGVTFESENYNDFVDFYNNFLVQQFLLNGNEYHIEL